MEILLIIALILAILGVIVALVPPPSEWSRFGVVLIGVSLLLVIAKALF